MCQFVSTKKVGDQHFYLTKADLKKKRFAEFKKYNLRWSDDIMGHGAIEFFYPELKGKGVHWECDDFSSPRNFPDCVVEDIKKGKFEGIGICLDILNEKGKEECEKIQQPARKEYEKIQQSAWEKYEKIQQSAFWKIAKQAKYRKKEWK